MEQKLTQEEFNKILKSKGYKIISIDNYNNYFTHYIRKGKNNIKRLSRFK